MKTDRTYLIKSTINNLLNLIVMAEKNGSNLISDIKLCKLFNVSRSTIREVIFWLCDEQIIQRTKKYKIILRQPKACDYFYLDNNERSKYDRIETFFINQLMSGDLLPGDKFSELELSKKSGCTTSTIREFLNRFSRNCLIEKIPRSGWKVVELDEELIIELTEFREMLEINSILNLLKLSRDNHIWDVFRDILCQHQQVRDDFDERHSEFHQLDRRFHCAIQQASKNRFTNKFFDIVFLVCHYYSLWDKKGKLAATKIALDQHIELLTYLLSHDGVNAILTMKTVMQSTQKNLLVCVKILNTKQSNTIYIN
ncbi:GntR family transcriptional regulator [Colwellia piezophila]|uniref:GntR family transcriptional regulator n=1 Tax=Colwellia piezophila TaxID=211668 RepID=UPI00035E22B8|nr:GntR family transcriptional regulator [Colwellia piezophila]